MRPGLITFATLGGAAGMFALFTLRSVDFQGAPVPAYRTVDIAGMVLALGLLGAALGQTVRQAKRVCREYAARAALIEGIDGVSHESDADREARAVAAAPEGEGRA
jgi:hypothetical protein